MLVFWYNLEEIGSRLKNILFIDGMNDLSSLTAALLFIKTLKLVLIFNDILSLFFILHVLENLKL